MKDTFNEKEIKKSVRDSISKFCRMRISKGLCEAVECDYCPVNQAYDMAREDDEGFEED